MTDNSYWQFQQTMVDAPLMLPPQPQVPLPPQQQQQQQQQQSWSEENEKRKWAQQGFGDFDMSNHTNKIFHMDDYSNQDPSEGDSPDSAGGAPQRRNDLVSESSLFQGGDQKQRRKEQNRAAQRAFRERKERYVKELQLKIREMEKKHEAEVTRVKKENESLKELVKKMEAEIYTLKGAAIAFDVSIHKLREAGLDVQQLHPRDSPSPPHSDRQSPTRSNSNERRHEFERFKTYRNDHLMSTDEDNDEEGEEASFAEREISRFDHKVDPIINSGIKLIPCSQIWERLSQHPNFDEFDMDRLCEELKKKAKCSGTGPVIPESELQEVLRRMDFGTA
ncbi:uncharacterized protein EV154DRAFT_567299 [Mucor mucedo]|uniref:uncharacterized protein n=1 Tax=Mucor mucedo TaxID=29922 RepID=UPI00221F5F92|nr:uncharacterized protein EV154DRAFT_567299 [Mucor mucedo]KAI7887600.1 hypothetical protein EV154DRAFT_567299 [Mucor mucedo]